MDSKVRNLITKHRIYLPKKDVERHYVKKENGGRCLFQLELTFMTTAKELKEYSISTTDWMLRLITNEAKEKRCSINKQINVSWTPHTEEKINLND